MHESESALPLSKGIIHVGYFIGKWVQRNWGKGEFKNPERQKIASGKYLTFFQHNSISRSFKKSTYNA